MSTITKKDGMQNYYQHTAYLLDAVGPNVIKPSPFTTASNPIYRHLFGMNTR
jgi:hypothetical protein